jgi:hypothetical protein
MVLTTSSNNKGCVIMLNRDAVFLDAESYWKEPEVFRQEHETGMRMAEK